MEKVLVLGNRGMLGHVLFDRLTTSYCAKDFEIIGINRSHSDQNSNVYVLDVLDSNALELFIGHHRPNYVINCIGILIKDSLANPTIAIKINALLPHFLNEMSEKYNFKFIHISTDCVFDGCRGHYIENDYPTETGMYGSSKKMGEIINERNLTIRTSIIGPELKSNHTGLLEWVFSNKGKVIDGYSRVFWSGLTTLELADYIIWVLKNDISGLVHATNNISISKYELLNLINEIFELKLVIRENFSEIKDKSLVNTRIIDYEFPVYRTMLANLESWMNKNIN
jgi:dTDP-4-dehydrorhamnose reductase